MALPPIVVATIQSAVLAATSNFLAQTFTAYRYETALVIDWVPIFQFMLYALISTPPNFMWQDILESSFPAYHISPTSAAVASAAADDDKVLEKEAQEGKLVEPKLNMTNTFVKTVLDQSVGAVVNTFMFSLFIHSIQGAMVRPLSSNPGKSVQYLLSQGAIDYSKVNWMQVVDKSKAEFADIMLAGWRFWPFVSLVNFAFIKNVEGRNLVGSLAGVAWGVYISLFAAR